MQGRAGERSIDVNTSRAKQAKKQEQGSSMGTAWWKSHQGRRRPESSRRPGGKGGRPGCLHERKRLPPLPAVSEYINLLDSLSKESSAAPSSPFIRAAHPDLHLQPTPLSNNHPTTIQNEVLHHRLYLHLHGRRRQRRPDRQRRGRDRSPHRQDPGWRC